MNLSWDYEQSARCSPDYTSARYYSSLNAFLHAFPFTKLLVALNEVIIDVLRSIIQITHLVKVTRAVNVCGVLCKSNFTQSI